MIAITLTDIRTRLDRALRERLQMLDVDVSVGLRPDFRRALVNYCLRGGKRIRPLIFLSGYAGYSGGELEPVMPVAVALELLHNFALIHDDLVDNAYQRRDAPSLHRELAGSFAGHPRASELGRSLAILAADALFAASTDCFLEAEIAPQLAAAGLKRLMRTAERTGFGVAAEVILRESPLGTVGRHEILELYDRKTVEYSFDCPLQLAALLGRAPEGEADRVAAYARCMGRAYQMCDDLNDLYAWLEGESSAQGLRLSETRLMLPMFYAWQRAEGRQRRWLTRVYARDRAGQAERRRLLDFMEYSGAAARTLEEAEALREEAGQILLELHMDPVVCRGLHGTLLCAISGARMKVGDSA